MIIYSTFYRRFVFRRPNQLTRLIDKSSLIELPKASVLHLLDDNFSMSKPITFVPSMTIWPMTLLPPYKFMAHIKEPPPPAALQYPEYFRLPPSGLNIAINNFRKNNVRFIRTLKKFNEMPTRQGVMCAMNYNSLYRARIIGMRRSTRRFDYIWRCVINNICRLPETHLHYIPIPIGSSQYSKSDFLMSFRAYTRATIKYPEDQWYLFMMNLIGYLHKNKTESLFENVPERLRDKIHFMLYGKTKVFIFTLSDIKKMNENDAILIRFIKLLNTLAEDSLEVPDAPVVTEDRIDQTQFIGGKDDTEAEDESDDESFGSEEQPAATLTPAVPDTSVSMHDEPVEELPIPTYEDPNIPELITPVLLSNVDKNINKRPKPKKAATTVVILPDVVVDTPDLIVDTTLGSKMKDYEKKPITIKRSNVSSVPAAKKQVQKKVDKKEETTVEAPTIVIPELETVHEIDPSLLTVRKKPDGLNVQNRVRDVTQEEVKDFYLDLITDIDTRAANAIKANEDRLTPAQKKRATAMSQAYKNIKFNNRPLIDIIAEVPDDTVGTAKLDFLEDRIVDKTMLKSSVQTFDHEYVTKLMEKDLVTNLVSFNTQGMFLKEITTEDTSDELDKTVAYKAKYEDVHHKEHTIKFTLPKVDERGYCMINGTLKTLKKQRVVVPICKISNVRVSLSSDYNKFLVERNTSVAHSLLNHVDKILKAVDRKYVIAIINSMKFPNTTLPYDYTAIASKYIKIVLKKHDVVTLYFNYPERYNWLKTDTGVVPADIEAIKAIEDETRSTFVGITKQNTAIFMTLSGEVMIFNYRDGTVVDKGICILDLLCSTLDVSVSRLSEWVDFKLLNKTVPMAFALSYRFGLSYMLNYTKTKYKIIGKNKRTQTKSSDIVITFADAKLIIPRAPLVNSLIFAGLNNFDLSKVEIDAMDGKDVYFELLQSKRISPHNLKGIDDYFEMFLDPITKDVLFRMGEPTDTKDLLIRATQLLTTEDHIPPASEANYRYRSYERFNTAVYKSIARALATYRNKAVGATNKMSISEFEVKQLIIQDQLMENVDVINPINDIKYRAEYGHSGFGGRQSIDTFMVEDRQYPDDGLGTMSEATVDNAKTGFTASLSANPVITNMRGMSKAVKSEDLNPNQILSVSSMLVPCVTNDDGKRANFVSIHLSQYMPTKKAQPSRIRTGFEEIIAHRTTPPFAYSAVEDGKVESIDENVGIITVFYPKSKTRVAIKFGEEYTNNGGGGFYCTQNVTINGFKVGDTFKRGDVITYNNRFFTPDAYSKQVAWNIGVLTNVVLIDANDTLEDSSIISNRLAEDLEVNPVFVKDIVLKKNTTIHKFADIGTKISSVDPLIVFDQSEMTDDMFGSLDDEAIKLLEKLNKKLARAGSNGEVVKIDMFYKSNITEVSPTIGALMTLVNRRKAAIRKAAGNAVNNTDFPLKTNIKSSDRISGVTLDDETVIIRFFIKDTSKMSGGDKIEFDSSLKSVCTSVTEPWEVEDGSVTCDAWFSSIGISNRIILSPLITGIGNRCVEKLERDILDMYFGKK